MTKLTEKQVIEIRTRNRDKHVIANCMEDYGLSYIQVWSILKGRTYRKYEIGNTDIPAQSVEKVPKLTPEQIAEINTTAQFWGSQTYFANKFGVSRTTIQRVLDQA